MDGFGPLDGLGILEQGVSRYWQGTDEPYDPDKITYPNVRRFLGIPLSRPVQRFKPEGYVVPIPKPTPTGANRRETEEEQFQGEATREKPSTALVGVGEDGFGSLVDSPGQKDQSTQTPKPNKDNPKKTLKHDPKEGVVRRPDRVSRKRMLGMDLERMQDVDQSRRGEREVKGRWDGGDEVEREGSEFVRPIQTEIRYREPYKVHWNRGGGLAGLTRRGLARLEGEEQPETMRKIAEKRKQLLDECEARRKKQKHLAGMRSRNISGATGFGSDEYRRRVRMEHGLKPGDSFRGVLLQLESSEEEVEKVDTPGSEEKNAQEKGLLVDEAESKSLPQVSASVGIPAQSLRGGTDMTKAQQPKELALEGGLKVEESLVDSPGAETTKVQESLAVNPEAESIRVQETLAVSPEAESINVQESLAVSPEADSIKLHDSIAVSPEAESIKVQESVAVGPKAESIQPDQMPIMNPFFGVKQDDLRSSQVENLIDLAADDDKAQNWPMPGSEPESRFNVGAVKGDVPISSQKTSDWLAPVLVPNLGANAGTPVKNAGTDIEIAQQQHLPMAQEMKEIQDFSPTGFAPFNFGVGRLEPEIAQQQPLPMVQDAKEIQNSNPTGFAPFKFGVGQLEPFKPINERPAAFSNLPLPTPQMGPPSPRFTDPIDPLFLNTAQGKPTSFPHRRIARVKRKDNSNQGQEGAIASKGQFGLEATSDIDMECETNSELDWTDRTEPNNTTTLTFGSQQTGPAQQHNPFTPHQFGSSQLQFGTPSAQPTLAGSVFGAQQNPPGFGGNMFGMQPNPAGNVGNMFGAQPNPSGTGMFGAQPNPFNPFGGQAPNGTLQFGAAPNSGLDTGYMLGVNAAPSTGNQFGDQQMELSVPGAQQTNPFGHPSSELGGGAPQFAAPSSFFPAAQTGSTGSFGDPSGSISFGSAGGGGAFSMGSNNNARSSTAQARARRRRKL